MRLVRLDNLNEMWELKRLYGINFVGVLNGHKYYKFIDNNIVKINEENVSSLLKLNGVNKLKLIIAAMYFETNKD
ncbi:hypothetical protein [Mycoplasmopsis edwardii]|uniref:Uncharacterized protein n=1 Tax=Mycoplasmopsis edwardii TaxID=53558 RepID=A0ACD4PI36_9BACT|nr:hypothetical protein [Mycoplasmopsis edwardii]WBP84347.1 hypothetical protein Me_995_000327 [Mycoplasmopsis edwardii]